MNLGIDFDSLRPFASVGFTVMFLFFLWQVYRNTNSIAKNLKAFSDQFGTNGSSLRSELTTLANKIISLEELLLKKLEEDKTAIVRQAQSMAAQDRSLAHLEGLVGILSKTMSELGLDKQMRTLLEAYVKKDIVSTTLNVLQASQSEVGQAASGAGIEQAASGLSKTQDGVAQIEKGIEQMKKDGGT